jgi:hypothetical protein
VKSLFSRWLPAIALTPTRKAVLGVAGVALAGAALTGAAHTVSPARAAPTAKDAAITSATVTESSAAKAGVPAPTAAANATAASPAAAAAAPVAPAAPAPPKEKALGYDFQLQPNFYYCGPAATRIALSALGQLHDFDQLAGELGTTVDGTNSAFDIARVLNANLGGNVYHTVEIKGQSATAEQIEKLKFDVVGAITSDHPIVGNVAGAAVDASGHQHAYGGHYLAIVGYGHNGDMVKIADPADTAGNGSYWMSTVDAANWMATHGYAVN